VPQKQLIAIGIGLRAGVLKICPEHSRIYCDEDVDPGIAFALAAELVNRRNDYVAPFADYLELAELLENTMSSAPRQCPRCGESTEPAPSPRGTGRIWHRVLEPG
jgi:hypothetical protein